LVPRWPSPAIAPPDAHCASGAAANDAISALTIIVQRLGLAGPGFTLYGSLIAWANKLELHEAVPLLKQNLDEEKEDR
jgi:ferritin-like metal-binding protein YciE